MPVRYVSKYGTSVNFFIYDIEPLPRIPVDRLWRSELPYFTADLHIYAQSHHFHELWNATLSYWRRPVASISGTYSTVAYRQTSKLGRASLLLQSLHIANSVRGRRNRRPGKEKLSTLRSNAVYDWRSNIC